MSAFLLHIQTTYLMLPQHRQSYVLRPTASKGNIIRTLIELFALLLDTTNWRLQRLLGYQPPSSNLLASRKCLPTMVFPEHRDKQSCHLASHSQLLSLSFLVLLLLFPCLRRRSLSSMYHSSIHDTASWFVISCL